MKVVDKVKDQLTLLSVSDLEMNVEVVVYDVQEEDGSLVLNDEIQLSMIRFEKNFLLISTLNILILIFVLDSHL